MQNDELLPEVRSALTMARIAVVKHLRESGGDPRIDAPDRTDLNYAADQIVRWRSLERSLILENCRSLFPELNDHLAAIFLDELFSRLDPILNPGPNY